MLNSLTLYVLDFLVAGLVTFCYLLILWVTLGDQGRCDCKSPNFLERMFDPYVLFDPYYIFSLLVYSPWTLNILLAGNIVLIILYLFLIGSDDDDPPLIDWTGYDSAMRLRSLSWAS